MNEIWSEVEGPDDAPLVVLVHGSMDRSTGMRKLSRRLAGAHRVVRYDRRGYGRSTGAGGPYGIEAHVADLAELVGVLDGGEAAAVFGHSYGGNVGLALAEHRPDLVGAVAVYEAPLSWLPWWPTTTAGSIALDGGSQPADAAEMFMRRLVGDARWEHLPASTREARRREGVAMVGELGDLRAGPPWEPPHISVPVVVMYGEHAAAHHRRGAEHLHRTLPGSQLVEIAGARHFGPNTHPDLVAAVIAELVSRR